MKRVLVAVTAIGMLVTVGLISSSNADSGKTTIYACSTARNGNLVKVSYDPVTCPAGTSPISWSTGAQGPKGDTGPKGDKGDQGEPGYSYGEVLASGNDVDSKEWSLNISNGTQPICQGPGFQSLLSGSATSVFNGSSYCIREFSGINQLIIMSMVSSTFWNGAKGFSARDAYMIEGTCPKTWAALISSIGSVNKLLLIDQMRPVSYKTNPNLKTCLALDTSDLSYMAPVQIIGETN